MQELKQNLPIVLVFGGSQGAQKINEAVIGIIRKKIKQRLPNNLGNWSKAI